MGEKIRLQKYMSQQGICSRRKAEEYIRAGQVFVNGNVVGLGTSIISGVDRVSLGNKAIQEQSEYVYYKIHKPRGIETTCAQKGGESIIDIVDIPQRIFPVGRLDKESTGLIILTNDGRITNYLTHPKYEHEKEYLVEVFGPIGDESLESMRSGVEVLGKKTKPYHIERRSSGKFSIVLTEGRNRQIRRMVEEVGGKVKKLHRIRVEDILLGKLKEGEYKELSVREKKSLEQIIFQNI